jgi:hypothetical protein
LPNFPFPAVLHEKGSEQRDDGCADGENLTIVQICFTPDETPLTAHDMPENARRK